MFNGLQWHVYVVDAEGEGGWGALGFLGCWEGRVCGGGGGWGCEGPALGWGGKASGRVLEDASHPEVNTSSTLYEAFLSHPGEGDTRLQSCCGFWGGSFLGVRGARSEVAWKSFRKGTGRPTPRREVHTPSTLSEAFPSHRGRHLWLPQSCSRFWGGRFFGV